MKFIIDAQLPPGLKKIFTDKGFDTIHTDDLPSKERTTDNEIRKISVDESRIVVTKDADFADSYYIKGIPPRLLFITTGNIKNHELFDLVERNFDQIKNLLETCKLVEMDNYQIIGHE